LGPGLALSNYEVGFKMKKAIGLIFLLAVVANCSLRKRALETPVPNEQVRSKDFFFKNGDINQSKRFVLGTAPIGMDTSAEGLIRFIMQENLHVNVEFVATENRLIGLEVNPSFPEDRSKWSKVIEIPILKHFYSENRKDEYGRETRELIENDQRSHWSRRTHMRLDLTGVQFFIERQGSSQGSKARTGLFVDGVEWDNEKQFLGFNVNERVTINYGRGQSSSSTFNVVRRVNLLAFESDKNFKATPYHVDNAKYFNILHTMGRQIEEGGNRDRQLIKAAKWDFSKPLDVYLNNVPEKYVSLFKDTLEAWAQSLRKIKAIPPNFKPFNVRLDYPSKYPFDLRYTTIHWIDDRRISRYSPLGVALNNADVETGKMLNANIIMYGGMMESLVNRYLSPAGAGSSALNFANPENLFPVMPLETPNIAERIQQNTTQILQNMTQQTISLLSDEVKSLQGQSTQSFEEKALLQHYQTRINELSGPNNPYSEMLRQIPNVEISVPMMTGNLMNFEQRTRSLLSSSNSYDLLSLDFIKESQEMDLIQSLQRDQNPNMNANDFEISKNANYHLDRTFADASPIWMSAIDALPPERQQAALRTLIRNVLLHELGHFLGLGHQFKGSVLPKFGTVPSEFTDNPIDKTKTNTLYYKSLTEVEGSDGKIFAKEPTNYTSIMDYGNGRGEVLLPEHEVVPGIHDELVLKYIYNGEVAVYNKREDKFDFFTHKEFNEEFRGKIPSQIKGMSVAYFPACNDIDASLLKDPECNRWDSGSRPVDIVKSYAQNIVDNLSQSLFNFTDTNELSASQAEHRLWMQAYDLFAHVRPFYEKLRIKLNTTPIEAGSSKTMWETLRYNEQALFAFSDACAQENPDKINDVVLKKIMKDKEVRELCLANLEVLKIVKSFMGLPRIDYTRIKADRYIHGGITGGELYSSMDKYFSGEWGELSTFPLKFVSLQSIMTSNPVMVYGGWIWPNLFYDYEGNRFLYRTLFPKDVTEITSIAVKENLSFSQYQNKDDDATSSDERKTLIGNTILSLAYFNWYMNFSALSGTENSRLTDRYLEILQSTTNFTFSPVALILKAVDPTTGDPTRIKKFTAELYDLNTQKSSQIQDFYILPGRKIIARESNRFIFPITKLRFYRDKEAFAIAYKIDFDKPGSNNDDLDDVSLRKHLSDIHKTVVEDCMYGQNRTGLAYYFGAEDTGFKGFEIQNGMATDSNDAKRDRFEETIDEEFANYENFVRKVDPQIGKSMVVTCNEALKAIGMISSVAAMMNGQWLGMTNNYVER
jgi:Pregnancy-associated plasma protein-A